MLTSNLRPTGFGACSAWRRLTVAACALAAMGSVSAQVELADQPVLSITSVPGNVALTPSVEWPTAVRTAHTGAVYSSATEYLGYFDPNKCYTYVYVADASETATNLSHFAPAGLAVNRTCAGASHWSGNFLNWATTPTIDPFRWALTGGYRVLDSVTQTILQKARHDGQGGLGITPDKTVTVSATTQGATPFSGTLALTTRGYGIRMRFATTVAGLALPVTNYTAATTALGVVNSYELKVRVRVCDPSVAAGGVEANCRQYGANWKPEGLIQQYSDRMRFSAFGYLNDSDVYRDGGVLRAQQKFVAPLQPVPSQTPIANPRAEWDAATGQLFVSPDEADRVQTNTDFTPANAVLNSGVINYINKFGQLNNNNYKSIDPVSELFYTALRYFKNIGPVASYSSMALVNASTREAYLDNFPVITRWNDPIQYSCQRNFILGIGDIYTHRDKNLPGPGTGTAEEPTPKPQEVIDDGSVDSVAFTNRAFALQGLANPNVNNYSGRNNSAGIVGLAYHANTQDIRPAVAGVPHTQGRQTVQTYWVDVLEAPFEANNQFYLAAKYGGFTVPDGYDPLTRVAPLEDAWWWTTGAMESGQRRPDNYFTAGRPDTMVAGLTTAFARIASNLNAVTTSFSLSVPQVTAAAGGNASYSAQYNANNWTGTVIGSRLVFDAATGDVTPTQAWTTNTTLEAQLAGTGWDTNRRVVTANSNRRNGGLPFRSGVGGIAAADLALLDTPYGAGVDAVQYLNYLRGDRSNEVGAAGAPLGYRRRQLLLGDVDGSRITAVGAPSSRYSDASNPGYSTFLANYVNRPPMAYVGANDGMLHAFNGSITAGDVNAGSEVFAYVPSALFNGPTSPAVDGLVSRGNPAADFVHRSLVNATAQAFDIDLARTGGPIVAGTTPNWRTLLIGGLGKGGRSYYALDVTNPLAGGIPNEATAAGFVRWEFPNASTPALAVQRMGFSYGEPLVTKTLRWGWVVILPSGYNNASGGSYLFFINPANGELLETVTVGTGTEPSEGLAHIQGFRRDFSNNTAESIYAGDLNGNIWRLDVRGSGAYPAPVNIARLTAPVTGARQPVTTRLLVEVDPITGRRFILVGTGRLLDDTDIASTAAQSFYAIIDGTATGFNTRITPITRTDLVVNTDDTLSASGLTLSPTQLGWYIDLPAGTPAARIILDPATAFRRVAFSTILPSGDACTPSGTSRVYLVDFGSGASALTNDYSYLETSSAIIDLRFVSIDGQQPRLYVGSRGNRGAGTPLFTGGGRGGGGGGGPPPPPPPPCLVEPCPVPGEPLPPEPLRRMNWREILLPQ